MRNTKTQDEFDRINEKFDKIINEKEEEVNEGIVKYVKDAVMVKILSKAFLKLGERDQFDEEAWRNVFKAWSDKLKDKQVADKLIKTMKKELGLK